MPPEQKNRTDAAIVLVDHDAEWGAFFEKECARLKSAPGISLDDIEHFGSTAIPNLIAKPIIDMMTPVAHMDDARRCVLKLQDLGYHRVETDFAKRVLFRRDDGATGLAYHLHFALCPAWPVKNELLFRDWLRDHTDVAAEYAELKRRLAGESHGDVVRYTYGKSAFIRRVICDARAAAGLPAETDWSE